MHIDLILTTLDCVAHQQSTTTKTIKPEGGTTWNSISNIILLV